MNWKLAADAFEQEARRQREWQPIETAPKDGTAILICRAPYGPVEARVAYWDESNLEFAWHVEDAAEGFNHHRDWPTHWMPLPPPPDDTGESRDA